MPDLGFDNLPFGQRNIYQFQLSFSQARLHGRPNRRARASREPSSRRAAGIGTTAAEAQLSLDVTRAFYDAALSDRLVDHRRVRLQPGAARPTIRRGSRSKPAASRSSSCCARRSRATTSGRPSSAAAPTARSPTSGCASCSSCRRTRRSRSTSISTASISRRRRRSPRRSTAARGAGPSIDRVSVQQAEALVGVREAGVTVARAERLPSVALTSSLAPVGYPSSGALPGRRRLPHELVARRVGAGAASSPAAGSSAMEASAQRRSRRGAGAARSRRASWRARRGDRAPGSRRRPKPLWEASAGTVQQAERAYQIAELRNREGLSTQLELSDSRLSLQVAQANRAQAARDVQVARARVALLPSLPVARSMTAGSCRLRSRHVSIEPAFHSRWPRFSPASRWSRPAAATLEAPRPRTPCRRRSCSSRRRTSRPRRSVRCRRARDLRPADAGARSHRPRAGRRLARGAAVDRGQTVGPAPWSRGSRRAISSRRSRRRRPA